MQVHRRELSRSDLVGLMADSRGAQEASRMQGREARWRIGPGAITRDDIIIIGVVHVSQGSWQPILQLRRYVF